MNIHRFISASIGIPLPASPLADLTHLDGLRMQTGDGRGGRPVSAPRPAAGANTTERDRQADDDFRLRRQQRRVRENDATDRRLREKGLLRD